MAAPGNPITSALRSFWHTMTSTDRHASHDAPYRTGQHLPLSQSRHEPLTSVATNHDESRATMATPLNRGDESTSYFGQPVVAGTPVSPYTPGMRRSSMQRRPSDSTMSASGTAEVQMQTFADGLPPPPPVSHSWKRIDRWTEDNYEELNDNISPGCSQNDINELEHELDCTLPLEVRESLQYHDGQERGGNPTGIIFGSMLLDCEEIVQEWKNWRKVNEEYLNTTVYQAPQIPLKAFGGNGESSSAAPPATDMAASNNWREELLSRQDSQPSNAIQKAYAHPAWIPLVRDWGGNNLAVDLAPGPAGKWGQVILMGRDYDCKYVVARSWAAFLATVADDMTGNKVFVHEETGELKLREFRGQNVEPGYLDILRWRTDQKYGRKPAKKRTLPHPDIRINSNVPSVASRGSPYSGSPMGDIDRGRSPQRFGGKGLAAQSPRAALSSPLARVAEEAPVQPATQPNISSRMETSAETDALISSATPPRMSIADESSVRDFANGTPSSPNGAKKENRRPSNTLSGLSLKNVDVGQQNGNTDDLKNVDI